MTANQQIMTATLRAQARMFRLAARDHDLTLKAIHLDTQIPYETLRSWKGDKGAQAMMPVWSISALAGIIPDDLLSLLTEPGDRHLIRGDDDDSDIDDYAEKADELSRKTRQARHPRSPGGTEIVACEEFELRRLKAELSRKAAA